MLAIEGSDDGEIIVTDVAPPTSSVDGAEKGQVGEGHFAPISSAVDEAGTGQGGNNLVPPTPAVETAGTSRGSTSSSAQSSPALDEGEVPNKAERCWTWFWSEDRTEQALFQCLSLWGVNRCIVANTIQGTVRTQ